MSQHESTRRKQQRISYACDFCHRRGLKCRSPDAALQPDTSGSTPSCLTCVEYGQQCTRLRQPKKRGTKRTQHEERKDVKSSISFLSVQADERLTMIRSSSSSAETVLDAAPRLDPTATVALLDAYLDTVHPAFPLFCERELYVGWRDGTFPKNEAQHASMASICALSAHHASSGTLFGESGSPLWQESLVGQFRDEAIRLTELQCDEDMRVEMIQSAGVLCLLGIQSGDYDLAHRYLSYWHGLCGRRPMHDESRWPSGLSKCDHELRRRIFWCFYRMEIHMACVTGQIIRAPEDQANVGYPVGTHHMPFVSGRDGLFEDWFSGWNRSTDLYRILEHVLVLLRMRRATYGRLSQAGYQMRLSECLDRLSTFQTQLEPQFLQAFQKSDDNGRNRCSFQSANIFGTMHLVIMIASVLQDNSFKNVLKAALAMLEGTISIPVEYYRAIGSPLLQQLTGVVYMLINLASRQALSLEECNAYQRILEQTISLLRHGQGQSDPINASIAKLEACLSRQEQQCSFSQPTHQHSLVGTNFRELADPRTSGFVAEDNLMQPENQSSFGFGTQQLPNLVSDICGALPDDLFDWNWTSDS